MPAAGERGPSIEFRNVSFAYGAGKPVLHDVSFSIPAGATAALIGRTGSGKTTIVNLLDRRYDVTSGKILIDGRDVSQAPPAEVRRGISLAPQRSQVLHDTVLANIRMGNPLIGDEDAQRASDAMLFSEVLERNGADLSLMMEPQGTNVSGGQRQRLSLARAYARPARIYLFDDSFSALDAKTEATVRSRLRERTAGATCLMVAQKISTVRDADLIIVLEKGRVEASGTHEELLASSPLYRSICESQRIGEGDDRTNEKGA